LYADEDSKIRGALIAMHEAAQENFRTNLNSQAGDAARAYIGKRGLAPETVEHFGLGYSDRSGRALLRILEQRGFSVAQMEQSGLVGKRQDGSLYDRFRNRLMFPIHDAMGKIIAFGGRALSPDDEPKYLNSPETTIYKKSAVLYNLHRAKDPMRKDDRVVLVEGYMDAIGVTAAGVGNVVASCGTALTETQVRLLKRHTHRIAVNFDPDAAGESAAERSLNTLLTEGMQVRVVELEDGLDPDEYCKEHGSDGYRDRVEHAKGYFYWLADRARTRFDMRTAEGKVAALNFLLPKVQMINDHLERMTLANELAGYVGIEKGAVFDQFRKLANERREPAIATPKVTLRPDERMLLIALLTEAEWRTDIVARLKNLQAIESLGSRGIFHAVFALDESGSNFGYDELNARLDPADQELLAHALLNEDFEITQEEVAASLESMRRTEDQFRRVQLKARIGEFERSGKLEDAMRLTIELQQLERASREARR